MIRLVPNFGGRRNPPPAMPPSVRTWGAWDCDPTQSGRQPTQHHAYGATFPWVFDMEEKAYVLQGTATLTADDPEKHGAPVTIAPGDMVTFPKGWRGTWTVHSFLRKVYAFFDREGLRVDEDEEEETELVAAALAASTASASSLASELASASAPTAGEPQAKRRRTTATATATTQHMKQDGTPDELLEGVRFATAAEIAALDNLSGQRIVLTGPMSGLSGCPPASGKQKDEAKRRTIELGGAWTSSLSRKSTILVVGPRAKKCGGTKTQKAKELRASGGQLAFWTAKQLAGFLNKAEGMGMDDSTQ